MYGMCANTPPSLYRLPNNDGGLNAWSRNYEDIIWGFDYNFTNYNFRRKKTNLDLLSMSYQRGELQGFIFELKCYLEHMVGEVVVNSPYGK